jgi:sugar phosphate isomerase/epimerase
MDRRHFLATLAAAAPALAQAQELRSKRAPRKRPGPICFFSKHLPKLSPREMARQLRAAGFEGIELTVRPGGHVSPDAVETALPKAIEDIRAEGMEVPIIATALTSAADPTARPILATAAKLGVPLFRPGWFQYALADVRQELHQASQALAALAEVGRRGPIALAYQNHVGNLGAALWDLDALVGPLDPRWAGVYFDIRHAVAEGSGGGWKPALHLLAPRVKVFSVKDFYWQRDPKTGWVAKDCPLGQGMVDLRTPLQILKQQGFAGPITVFNEYETGSDDAVVTASARDLKYLRAQIAEVG